MKFKIIYVFLGDILVYCGDVFIVFYFLFRGFIEIFKDDIVVVILGECFRIGW